MSLATVLDPGLQLVMLPAEDILPMIMIDEVAHPVDTLPVVMVIVIEALLVVVTMRTIVHVMRALQEPVVRPLMIFLLHEVVTMTLTVPATTHPTHTLMAVLHMTDHLRVTILPEMSLMSIAALLAIGL